MKRLMLMALVGLMIAGSIAANASDLTSGKMDAVAMDQLEGDIQHDITEGKIQAVMIQNMIFDITSEIEKLSAMQDELSDISNTGGLLKAFGVVIDTATAERDRLNDSMNSSSKDFEKLLQSIRHDKATLGKLKDQLLKSHGK